MSLPRIFATSLENLPADVPYLTPNAELVQHWRRELGEVRDFKVGIAWQGNPNYADDRRRSVPLRSSSLSPGSRVFASSVCRREQAPSSFATPASP